jgi:DNA-binding transcriptional MerR regulator
MTAMSMAERYLSPAETAERLGVSVKALRLYERYGLVTPVRSLAGWRTYGPPQIAQLHQVLALKRLGLPLARIGDLLSGHAADLDRVLAVQELALARENERLSHALELVRMARGRLASGEALSIDDLTILTQETTMASKPSEDDMQAIFDPLAEKHFTPEQLAELRQKNFDQAEAAREWEALISEAKGLMEKGDPSSPEAIALARRWNAQIAKFTGGDPDLMKRAGAVWRDAMADPEAAPQLPLGPSVFTFIGKATEAAKAAG